VLKSHTENSNKGRMCLIRYQNQAILRASSSLKNFAAHRRGVALGGVFNRWIGVFGRLISDPSGMAAGSATDLKAKAR
jgi:hypothetical protein